MLEITTRKWLWSKTEIWFSETFLNRPQCDYLVLKHCGSGEADQELIASRQKFTTLHVDLSLSEESLWSGLSKTCRNYIRNAEKLNLDFEINRRSNDFLLLLNEIIGEKKYTKKVSHQQYQHYMPHGDLFTVAEDNTVLCGHFYLKDRTRCRLLWSASKRMTKGLEKKISLINRWLHWKAIQHYRKEGLRIYDFGGVDLDKNSGAYGITKFKLSFGGAVVEEYHYSVINSVPLKIARTLGLLT